jgi:polysaccharide biosynthesis transport protein
VLMATARADPQMFASALTLARALARRGSTILVSADSGAGGRSAASGGDGEQPRGLNDLVAGAASLTDVIEPEEKSQLHLMGFGREGPARASDLTPIIEALARTYDFVVFATSTAMNALSLAPMFDKVLLRASEAKDAELLEALSQACDDVCFIEDSAAGAIGA